jgi:hypothetical protein
MNLFNIISEIEKIDPEANERYSFYSRRNLFKISSKMAAAGILQLRLPRSTRHMRRRVLLQKRQSTC